MDPVNDLGCQYVEEHDLVSAYLGERLSEPEAEAFERHYFGCERCWREVKAGEEIRAALSRGKAGGEAAAAPTTIVRPGPWTTPRVLMLAAAVAIAAAGAALFLRPGAARPQRSGIEWLAEAAGPRRTTEARLAGPFQYAPITRGGGTVPTELNLAMSDAIDRAKKEESAQNLHVAGVAFLLANDTTNAIDYLKKASSKAPKDAVIESDLAAALIAVWSATGDTRQLEEAFETASDAASHDAKSAAAHFNKALAAQELGYRDTAKKEWEIYLADDPSSGWAQEARQRLATLSNTPLSMLWPRQKDELLAAARETEKQKQVEIVSRYPDRVRQLVADELLPLWAATGSDADRSLDSAEQIGDAFAEATGDPILRDSIAFVRASSGNRLNALRDAHDRFGKARSLQKEKNFGPAGGIFQETELAFREAGSPFALLVSQEVAATARDENDFPTALRIGREIEAKARGKYPAVFARSRWLTGLVEISQSHPAEAVRAYSEALQGFESVKDRESAAFVHSLLAEAYQEMGESDFASRHRREALTTLAVTGPSTRRYVALNSAAYAAEEERRVALARAGFLEAAEEGGASESPDIVVSALLSLARAEYEGGDSEASSAHLAKAARLCGAITDPSLRERSTAELHLTEGFVLKPSEAVDSLSAAAAFFQKFRDFSSLAEIQSRRGDLHLASGRPELARQDFLMGVHFLETERRLLPPKPSERIAFFERAQPLFDHTVSVLAESGESIQAAAVVESGRARTLLDMVGGDLADGASGGDPRWVAALAARVPPETAVVEFVVLPDRLLAFVFRDGAVRLTTTEVGRDKLRERVLAASRELDPKSESGAGGLEGLHAVLIEPLAPLLAGAQTIVLSPDKELKDVAFAALRSRSTGRYLVEDYRVGVTPSLTFYVRSVSTDRGLQQRAAPPSVLVVADPRFDAAQFPELRRLRNAGVEARAIASHSARAVVLEEDAATRGRFLAAAPTASLIHFAGHAIVRPDAEFSSLVFAPDPQAPDSGLLYSYEISSLRLTQTRLVVLASCGSAAGLTRGQEGALSIARAFLAAGAPAVVASLQDLDDRIASQLLSRFHEAFAAGEDAVAALADVQRSAIHDRDSSLRHPAAWACLELVGGVAPATRKKV